MKTLFIGGIKSGKSINAQNYTLKHSKNKPLYLATTEFFDEGMRQRIQEHQAQRAHSFHTLEEPLEIYKTISHATSPVLLECVSMWINNMLYHQHNFEDIKREMQKVLELPQDVVFVLNDVGSGIIPENKLAREYIDISGKIAQMIANRSDAVFHCIAGIATKIK